MLISKLISVKIICQILTLFCRNVVCTDVMREYLLLNSCPFETKIWRSALDAFRRYMNRPIL